MLMATGALSAPAGMVKVGLRYPPAAATTQPPAPHAVAQPVPGAQLSVELVQMSGVPPQTPAVHTSPEVQMFPSLHEVPSATLSIAGHRPLTHLFDSSTWHDDEGTGHSCLWQVSCPLGPNSCADAACWIQAQKRNSSKVKLERRDMAHLRV